MKSSLKLLVVLLLLLIHPLSYSSAPLLYSNSSLTASYDQDYTLKATMLGYFDLEGTRNPVLKAQKGETVRITIINGEPMTHDIALEKAGIISKTLSQEGESTSIVFTAVESDIYFCSIPGHRLAGMEGKFEVVEGPVIEEEAIVGQLPQKDGKTLNLDFEAGTLADWTATGEAFKDALISQDPSPVHDKDTKIGMEGSYFISSGGTKNYSGTGTLTSVPFTVTQPYASFKVSGGALQDTRVELVRADNEEVFFSITGSGRATLQPVVVDLSELLDKDLFIRIVDNETGISQIPYIGDDKWAHINFDDFRFYAERPDFSNELKAEDIISLPPLDRVVHSGLSGEGAAKVMTLPDGFSVTLAAAEPDIVRPIAFTLDARGRLWVVEAHNYPLKAPEGEGQDRVLIFEDTNGDGVLDSRKIFMEGLNLVSAIEVGMGGVWLGAAPELLFVPLDTKKDKPAGPVQVLLDGWGTQDTHEILNSFRWGPDGWLYGTHGVFTHSNVGKPGAPDEERTKLNAGVWRYHPTTQEFELFAEGTSNPWGVDFNEYGHPFITVCVIPHMFHAIQGGRYLRQAGQHFNPFTYNDIAAIGDHVHWVGDRGPHAGNFRSNSKGGGHAHAGAMIYLGSEDWPEEYRNNIFLNNIHGARVNVDKLNRKGSGYTASHQEDFVVANDSWSQWLNFRYDASGSVFAIDWYDKNQCHSPNPDVHQKTMGRIFKISHDSDQWKQVDLSKASIKELVDYHLEKNEWYVRTARLILQERGPNKKAHKLLRQILENHPDVTKKLAALWTLHVTQGINDEGLLQLTNHENEYLRSWAIQLMAEDKELSDPALRRMVEIAKTDESALVRLYLASAMQRIAPERRWDVLEALFEREEDQDDHNMPLMLWYAFEPTVATDVDRALKIAQRHQMSELMTYTIQRVGAVQSGESTTVLRDLLKGLESKEHTVEQHQLVSLLKKELENK